MTDRTAIKVLLVAKHKLTTDNFRPVESSENFYVTSTDGAKGMKSIRKTLIDHLINHEVTEVNEVLVY
ncbi:MAG: hypothetical protein P4L35_17650 [Ignavibacteriaceae bacterium]|nr:hypothetical protein [Ignavibacteriaceae bacterium]